MIQAMLDDQEMMNVRYILDWGLQAACEGGHRDIAELMISKGATDLRDGLEGACEYGHRHIVEFFFEIAEKSNDDDYVKVIKDCALKSACANGRRDLVDFVISKGANSWEYGFVGACAGGHRDIVDLMISKGATDWKEGFISACDGGHRDIVDLMIEKGATAWDEGFVSACAGGHRDIVDLMIKKGANDLSGEDWYNGFLSSCQNGHIDLVRLIIEKGGTWDIRDWEDGLNTACEYGCKDIIVLMIEKGATNIENFDYYEFLDQNFVARIFNRLSKTRREQLREKFTSPTLAYLINRHIFVSKDPTTTHHRAVMRNILQLFTCNDIATWSIQSMALRPNTPQRVFVAK